MLLHIHSCCASEYDAPGLAVKHAFVCQADLCSSFLDSNELWHENRGHVLFVVLAIIEVTVIIVIILQVNALLETLELKDSAQRKGHFALYNCLATPSTMVCSGFTATSSLQNHFTGQITAATHGTSLWFGIQVLLSWSRQIQFGTHGFCSFSLPPHKPTPGPNRLTVLSCRRWKHMMILRMVFIDIIVIIVSLLISLFYWDYCENCHYGGYWNYSDNLPYCIYLGWLGSIGSRVELDHKNPILYVRVSWENCRLYQLVTRLQSHTTCATTFLGHLATTCRFVHSWALGWSRDMQWNWGLSARLSCHMEKGSMWTRLQSTIFGALSSPLWWVKASSSWFFQQCSVLSRCLPSMRVGEWTVVELGWG